jgi:hypothetical protein
MFVSVREVRSQDMIVNIPKYEKERSPFIGIEELKAIGRLIRPIKARIEAAGTGTVSGSFTAPLAVGSYATFSQTGSAHFAG